MYQFYYSDYSKECNKPEYKMNIQDVFNVTAVRPSMWEEHCLECSAPACYGTCPHYIARKDGRCRRFFDGYHVYENDLGCNGQGMRIRFRKWANMMTIIFPAMLDKEGYRKLNLKNDKLGRHLQKIVDSHLPVKVKWFDIRSEEFIRRKKLRNLEGMDNIPDAFVFHGYSYYQAEFHLFIEVYDDHTSVFKTSLLIKPGENLLVIPKERLNESVWKKDFLVKIYPENDLEAELDVLWCDFVKGTFVQKEKPAEKVKCLVWDLDNTIWNGTLIETDDIHSLTLNPGVFETIKKLDEKGIIQSISSKNDFEPAWEAVKNLGIDEFFIYPQIHWNAKSGSIEVIARSLNIGIDSLALIDDSAFEREQVHSVFPQVRTYDINELNDLQDKPEFDVLVTEESKNRRLMYRAEEKRNQLMSNEHTDLLSFLRKCNLQICIFTPETKEQLERCYELVVRTNQLNMSGKKYSNEEFNEILNKKDHHSFAFSCKDDFGEYGIVGFGQYKTEQKSLCFTEFAMSCRVAGKFAESALFLELLNKEGCSNGMFNVIKTRKNSLLRRTLSNIGFKTVKENNTEVLYQYDRNLVNADIVNVVDVR